MLKRLLTTITIVLLFLLQAKTIVAEKLEPVFGSQLMSKQERMEHRTKIRGAKTGEDRERIRRENHEKMKARAKEQGLMLSEEPPAAGQGVGVGARGGGGAGQGKGRN